MSESQAAVVPAQSALQDEVDRRYLFASRTWDFWLLGGLAILLWLPIYFLTNSFSPIQAFAGTLPAAAFLAAYWVNYPHFMASYKLAYGQGASFIRGNAFQLVVVPVALVLSVLLAMVYWDADIRSTAWVQGLNGLFAAVGLNVRLGLYPSLGPELLGFLLVFMYFTVGWHYAKQTFGCMMVYARLDGYALTNVQRNIIRYALLSTWWMTWLYANCSVGTYPFYELQVHRLGLPPVLYEISKVVTASLIGAFLVGVLAWNYRLEGRLPSVNFLVPLVALLLWHVPLLGQPQYFYMIGFFHALQYFPFVSKVEAVRGKKQKVRRPIWRMAALYGVLALTGFLAFDYVPNALDSFGTTREQLGMSFFLIAFLAFINIHHYFIDNVLWRFKNKEVREYLFEGTTRSSQ